MLKNWWYASGSEKRGPFSLDDLRDLLAENRINAQSLLWATGRPGWERMADIQELRDTLYSTPPDIPTELSSASKTTPPRSAQPATEVEPPQRPVAAPVIETASTFTPALASAGAWRRFFARLVDLYVLSMPLGLAVGYWGSNASLDFALWLQRPGSSVLLGIGITPLALLAEAMIFGLFGTTLGKGLLGVQVLTTRIERPTFSQYLARQLGVYFYGLAMGIPFVNLFTIAAQSTRLKKGRAATYDERRFTVQASRLGFMRSALAVAVCAVVFITNAVLLQMDKDAARTSNAALSWTNPETGKQATLEAGWTLATQKNALGQDIVRFSNAVTGAVIIFAYEDVGPSLTVRGYGQAWVKAVKETMTVEISPAAFDAANRPAAVGVGKMVDKEAHPMNVYFTLINGRVWRVVTVGLTNESLTQASVIDARDRLLATL